MTIKARVHRGRLVVDAIQTLTGVDGTVTLDVTMGAPAAATSWYFAEGRADVDTLERIAVFNPSETTAMVEVELGRPIQSRDLAKIAQIAREQFDAIGLGDGSNAQIGRADTNALLFQA